MKKLFSLFLLLLLIAIFSGCSMKLEQRTVRIPTIGNTDIAEIGQNMYEKYFAYYPLGYNSSVELLTPTNSFGDLLYFKQDKSGCSADIVSGYSVLFDKECKNIFDYESDEDSSLVKLKNHIKYKKVPLKPAKIDNTSFKYDVLYQGKIGNKINISFREFYANATGSFIIRPAFTQNIEYELDENGQALIGFKGLRIKVLEATNFNIKYKVLEDFSE